MRKHPYYVTARDEQREAFINEVRAMIEQPTRISCGRVLRSLAQQAA